MRTLPRLIARSLLSFFALLSVEAIACAAETPYVVRLDGIRVEAHCSFLGELASGRRPSLLQIDWRGQATGESVELPGDFPGNFTVFAQRPDRPGVNPQRVEVARTWSGGGGGAPDKGGYIAAIVFPNPGPWRITLDVLAADGNDWSGSFDVEVPK